MISYDELNTQNHRITELSNVLGYLVQDRAMCDSATCCELFHRYLNEVTSHIDMVERKVYPLILTHGGEDTANSLNNFMNGSQEIKKIVKQYTRRWCKARNKYLRVGDHAGFIGETDDLFELVLDRLQDEMEKLYPMARAIEA